MGMGHDDPLNVLQLDSKVLNGTHLIRPLAGQTHVNQGEILRRGVPYDIDMGIRDHFVLTRDVINTFHYFSHHLLL
jgi:hypothetical protein